jgi:hypothetical protein
VKMTKELEKPKQKKAILLLITFVVVSLLAIVCGCQQTKTYQPSTSEEIVQTVEAKATTNSTPVRNAIIPSAAMNSVSSSKVVANAAVVVDNSAEIKKILPSKYTPGLVAKSMLSEENSESLNAIAIAVGSSTQQANKLQSPSNHQIVPSDKADSKAVVLETANHPPPIIKAKPSMTSQEKERLREITKPFANVTTIGFKQQGFPSGYRNQIQAFSAFVVLGGLANHSQILMPTLSYKDTFGSNRFMPFEFLFDVEHWNSFYPALPRMVHCDQELFPNYDCEGKKWLKTDKPTMLHAETRPNHHLFSIFMRYSGKQRGPMMAAGFRNAMELLMIKGALRPHPDLLVIVNRLLGDLGGNGTVPYMTLHARVEPDMMKHPVCKHVKENNLTKIFEMVEETFPDPPATKVFMPINRQYMEAGGKINTVNPNSTNWMAVQNLEALNRAVEDGLWGGRAKVFEFGSNALKGTRYESRPSTTGAVLNFFIAQNANVFVGTRISSYSMDLLHARFYNGNIENYQYLPSGLERWTGNTTKHPPGFQC